MNVFRSAVILRIARKAILFVLLSMLPGAALAFAEPPSSAPAKTPYETHPFLFSSPEQAISALNNPDILMRRSGVEWLGRCTGTDGGSTEPINATMTAQLCGHTEAIPALIRGVREMPDQDSQQAAVLLSLYPTKESAPAIPVVCEALLRPACEYPQNARLRSSYLDALMRICGGPDSFASSLIPWLKDHDPATRRSVAAAFRFTVLLPFTSIPIPAWDHTYPVMPFKKQKAWIESQYKAALPALLGALKDRNRDVRLAVMRSLETMGRSNVQTSWETVVGPLAHCCESSDPEECLYATKALAALRNTDISLFAHALRNPLRISRKAASAGQLSTAQVSDYTHYTELALTHAAISNRERTLDAFLTDLTARNDVDRRRAAATDLNTTIMTLWSCREYFSVDQRAKEERADAEREASQIRLLTALTAATHDSDGDVARDSALTLEQIGKWAYETLGNGGMFREAVRVQPQIADALKEAAKSVASRNPTLSTDLFALSEKVRKGRESRA